MTPPDGHRPAAPAPRGQGERVPDEKPEDAASRLLEMHDRLIHSRALQTAAELGIGDLLADGPRTAADLAAATSTRPDALYRLLRLLGACGVLTETEPGGPFALTPSGGPLRSDHPFSVRSTLAFGGVIATAFNAWTHSLRTGEASFPEVFGAPFFDYLEDRPEHGALFNAAMEEMSRPVVSAVVGCYDFAAARRIVDVGGGNGTLMSAVLRTAPEAHGIILDAPHVVGAARGKIRDSGLEERCTVVGGDFFQKVPEGGDLYLLKWILHDWPDDRATAILRGCRQAMAEDGRVVLVETVVPPGDTPHPSKTMDLSILALLGGLERTEEQFASLLADAGLRLRRVVSTPSPFSLIEAESV
ncbi:acetylserotonin O-methyltransferase [Allosalinactinospora lopnorensis]|uniref:acetylserotonin O-methyltransferase n=1 Tax=Allosalinactinospora lopnorensis TaxID=1352348 RepID=UPI000A6B245C|nr:acetylserotonin O-methyltransferase [Allosalinactinospora lopnorensis]